MSLRMIICALLVAVLATMLLAQPPVGGGGGGVEVNPVPQPIPAVPAQQNLSWIKTQLDQLAPLMVTTGDSLFVIRNGMMVKYDIKTLKAEPTVELLAPIAIPANNMVAREDVQKISADYQVRMVPAAVRTTDKEILLIWAKRFYRIDIISGKVLTNVELITDTKISLSWSGSIAPVLEEKEGILYIFMKSAIWAVNTADGKVISTTRFNLRDIPATTGVGIPVAPPPPVPAPLPPVAVD